MELNQCFKWRCKRKAEYICQCTSPGILSCKKHVGEHMELPGKAHAFEKIFVEPCKGTKEAILEFLTREESKNSKLKGRILASFSQRLLESENDIEELLKSVDSASAEIGNYFTKISQAQKSSKSELDPVLGLLSLQPGEAVERLKKIIPVNQEWQNSAKLFCGFREKIETMIEFFIKDKFEEYFNSRLNKIEKSLEDHNKSINLSNEEHKKDFDLMNDELANIKDTISNLINENKKICKNLENLKEEINSNMENEMDQINSQIININQNLKKGSFINSQNLVQELRDKRLEILNKANDPELEKEFRENCSIYQSHTCIKNSSIHQAYQDYNLAYRQKTSLYSTQEVKGKTNLFIYDTENESKEVRVLEPPELLDHYTCITQLPGGNLFCFGSSWPVTDICMTYDEDRCPVSGICLIIDENYRIQHLPSGTPCCKSSSIYFNNSVYCFGGSKWDALTLSERFDLNKKQWIKLKPLPQADEGCMNIIFNGNILISGQKNKNLLRYSIVSNTFVTIPFDFAIEKRKIIINSERLYLIECGEDGSVYESEISNDSVWRRIGDSIIHDNLGQVYLIYNKGAINIAYYRYNGIEYFKFNLKEKTLEQLV